MGFVRKMVVGSKKGKAINTCKLVERKGLVALRVAAIRTSSGHRVYCCTYPLFSFSLQYLESNMAEGVAPAGAIKSVKVYRDSLERRKGRS